jgi:hypothetical protein
LTACARKSSPRPKPIRVDRQSDPSGTGRRPPPEAQIPDPVQSGARTESPDLRAGVQDSHPADVLCCRR